MPVVPDHPPLRACVRTYLPSRLAIFFIQCSPLTVNSLFRGSVGIRGSMSLGTPVALVQCILPRWNLDSIIDRPAPAPSAAGDTPSSQPHRPRRPQNVCIISGMYCTNAFPSLSSCRGTIPAAKHDALEVNAGECTMTLLHSPIVRSVVRWSMTLIGV